MSILLRARRKKGFFLQLHPFFADLVVGIDVPFVSLTAGYCFLDAGVFKREVRVEAA